MMAEENAKKEISNKRRSRTQIINYVNKLYSTEIEKIQADFKTDADLVNLQGLKDLIEKKLAIVNTLSQEITESIDDDGEYAEESEKFMDDEAKQAQNFTQLSYFLKSKIEKKPNPVFSEVNPAIASSKSNIKLPKLMLKKFDGKHMDWSSFYDSFKQAVHNNAGLSDIEKMNYLVGYLSGEAELTI